MHPERSFYFTEMASVYTDATVACKTKKPPDQSRGPKEAQTGFEPVNQGVADLCLTLGYYAIFNLVTPRGFEPLLRRERAVS